jgi:hypothetical protein
MWRFAGAAVEAWAAGREGNTVTVGHWADDGAGRRRVRVGLLAEEGVPSRMAEALDQELPQILNDRLSSEVVWEVDHRSESLPLDRYGEIPLSEIAQKRRGLGWDIAILLTDLPRRAGTQPIVSDYSVELGVGLLSMPALGAWHVRRRTRALVVHLTGHLLEDALDLDGSCTHLGRHFRHVRHIRSEAEHVDEHLGLVGVRGRSRLLLGMVLDNRPGRLVPHLAGATAAAAATAAYGVFTVTFWKMADVLPAWRLGLISVVSIAAMATWLLLYNRLWEKPSRRSDREKALLYNLSTLITLTFGVACMYAILYIVALVASFAVIDSGYLSSQLGHASDPMNYSKIVWLASSVGIVAGALGSSFESEEAVRQATYSKRERERQRETQPSHGGEQDVGATS